MRMIGTYSPRLAEAPPHPAHMSAPTSPRTRGEVSPARRIRFTAMVALTFAVLAPAAPGRAADAVTIGTVGSASANLWPVFLGITEGFFAAEDLKIDIV